MKQYEFYLDFSTVLVEAPDNRYSCSLENMDCREGIVMKQYEYFTLTIALV